MKKTYKTSNNNNVISNQSINIDDDSDREKTNCFAFYTKLPKSESFHKMQLTLLNSGLLSINSEDPESAINVLIPQTPMELSKFRKYVHRIRRYDILTRIEFKLISKVDTYSSRHANKPENQIKNSYKKYLPFDYNRVVLKTSTSQKSKSDYINASYIDSLLKPNAYIVAQGPNEHTIVDFWQMIWQSQAHIIVMLTKVFDFIRVMCAQYWPSTINSSEVYGPYEVTLIDEDKLADYVIRTIKVTFNTRKKSQSKRSLNQDFDCGEYRIIYQLHYNAWSANSCPFSDSILKFRKRVKLYCEELSDINNGPLIVHCSDGCGRTGTYLCLDANLQLAEEEGMVDIFNYAKLLRESRKGMIENVEQYKFIYETIEEFYVCGKTWFPLNEISQQLKYKSTKNPITKQNEYQREFEKLLKMTSKLSIGECAGGHRVENRDKNRDVSIVPPDNFRPYLSSFQCNDSTDYINAVFVDGYTRPKEYIVTEWPMIKTIADIWSLIYDHDCNSVVVLGGVPNNKSYPIFWPKESCKNRKYGPVFTVETMSRNNPPSINSWIFKINKKVASLTELMAGIKAEPKITQIFEFVSWPYGHKVPTSTNALVELINMVERWRQRTSYGPVLVISANGKSRAGVYCAANLAIEQVVAHQEVDIFNAVKTVRRHRPALIENITEYKYCYDLTLHYVSHYLNKTTTNYK